MATGRQAGFLNGGCGGSGDVKRRRPASLAASAEEPRSWGRAGEKRSQPSRAAHPRALCSEQSQANGVSAEQVRGDACTVLSERLGSLCSFISCHAGAF